MLIVDNAWDVSCVDALQAPQPSHCRCHHLHHHVACPLDVASSMPVSFVIDDKQLPNQCWSTSDSTVWSQVWWVRLDLWWFQFQFLGKGSVHIVAALLLNVPVCNLDDLSLLLVVCSGRLSVCLSVCLLLGLSAGWWRNAESRHPSIADESVIITANYHILVCGLSVVTPTRSYHAANSLYVTIQDFHCVFGAFLDGCG